MKPSQSATHDSQSVALRTTHVINRQKHRPSLNPSGLHNLTDRFYIAYTLNLSIFDLCCRFWVEVGEKQVQRIERKADADITLWRVADEQAIL